METWLPNTLTQIWSFVVIVSIKQNKDFIVPHHSLITFFINLALKYFYLFIFIWNTFPSNWSLVRMSFSHHGQPCIDFVRQTTCNMWGSLASSFWTFLACCSFWNSISGSAHFIQAFSFLRRVRNQGVMWVRCSDCLYLMATKHDAGAGDLVVVNTRS